MEEGGLRRARWVPYFSGKHTPSVDRRLGEIIDDGKPQHLDFLAHEWEHLGGHGMDVDDARRAVERIDPQMVIETILAREWENWSDDTRWQDAWKDIDRRRRAYVEGKAGDDRRLAEVLFFTAELDRIKSQRHYRPVTVHVERKVWRLAVLGAARRQMNPATSGAPEKEARDQFSSALQILAAPELSQHDPALRTAPLKIPDTPLPARSDEGRHKVLQERLRALGALDARGDYDDATFGTFWFRSRTDPAQLLQAVELVRREYRRQRQGRQARPHVEDEAEAGVLRAAQRRRLGEGPALPEGILMEGVVRGARVPPRHRPPEGRMMEPSFPYNAINLVGDGIMRVMTIALPRAEVLDLLPHGLELGEQDLTAPGLHPVVFHFQEMIRAHMTIPNLLPNLTYHEQVVGVPFTYVTGGLTPRSGPFFYMPNLYLDDAIATLGGRFLWGFSKHMARAVVTESTWTAEPEGDPVISLDFEPTTLAYAPVNRYPHIEAYCRPVTGIMVQPLIGMLPAAMGPIFVCSNWDKKWDDAVVRPLTTAMRIDRSFVPALPCGRFPDEGRAPGIDRSPIGAFELRARWRLGLVYPTWFHARWSGGPSAGRPSGPPRPGDPHAFFLPSPTTKSSKLVLRVPSGRITRTSA